MARLPQPGGDNGTWGNVLNDYLSQAHKTDGNLKDNIVTSSVLAPNAVTASTIQDGTISEAHLDSSVQNKLNTAGSGNVADGTITTVKLHDDAVTTVKLADDAVTDAKVSATAAIAKSKLAPLNIADADVTAISQNKISGLTAALSGKADTSHTHVVANISDSTATGRSLLTATDAIAARTAIGAGTSNLVLGTTNTTAKAGDYTPTKADVGLGNVDNTSDTTKNSAPATLTNKIISGANNTLSAIPVSALNATGTPNGTTFLRGDGAWAAVTASGPGGTPLSAFMRPAAESPYPASDISSLTVSSSAPSFSGMRYYPWNNAGIANFIKITGKLTDFGGAGFNMINGASSAMAITGYSLESFISGDRFSFQIYSYGDHDYKLFIDDMPVSLSPTHFSTTAGSYFITVVFNTLRTRKVRLLLGQTGFVQALTSSNGLMWAAAPRFKVAVIGDSFTQGNGGSTEGAITSGTIAGGLAQYAGFDIYNLGQGGSGYSNPGNGTNTAPGPNGVDRFGAASRLAALAALPAMDVVMVVGGANDGDTATYPVATTVSRAQTLWSAIQSARPATPLIVAGVESGVYPAINANLDSLNNALKAAAQAHSGVTAYIDMRNPMWVYGTGKLDAQVGDGNADIFVSSDGVHPSHAGWDYESCRLVAELAKIAV